MNTHRHTRRIKNPSKGIHDSDLKTAALGNTNRSADYTVSSVHEQASSDFWGKCFCFSGCRRRVGVRMVGAEQWGEWWLDHASYKVSGRMQDMNNDGGVLSTGWCLRRQSPSVCHPVEIVHGLQSSSQVKPVKPLKVSGSLRFFCQEGYQLKTPKGGLQVYPPSIYLLSRHPPFTMHL